MPHEDRRIIFDYAEVYKAVFSLCVQKNIKKPPAGDLRAVREDEEDQSKIFLSIVNNLEETEKEVEYSRDFIAAALMLYCRTCHIPLPKTARKSVLLDNGNVVLRVQL